VLDDVCTALGRSWGAAATGRKASDGGRGASGSGSGEAAGSRRGAAGAEAPVAALGATRQRPAGLSHRLRRRLAEALRQLRYWPSHQHGKYIWRVLRVLHSWRRGAGQAGKAAVVLGSSLQRSRQGLVLPVERRLAQQPWVGGRRAVTRRPRARSRKE
jgi:hypothetical protein